MDARQEISGMTGYLCRGKFEYSVASYVDSVTLGVQAPRNACHCSRLVWLRKAKDATTTASSARHKSLQHCWELRWPRHVWRASLFQLQAVAHFPSELAMKVSRSHDGES